MSLPDEAMKLKDGKIIYDQLASMVAVQYSEAESNPAGSYVIYNGSVYLLPNGHTANTSWANTEKEGPTNIGEKLSSQLTEINSKADVSDVTELEEKVDQKADEPTGTKSTGKVYGLDSNLNPAWVEKDTDPETIAEATAEWLDDHPEATTTVEDGSITKAKLNSNLAGEIDRKAPAIMDVETDYRHKNVNSFTMIGNEYAFGTARYANKENLIKGYSWGGVLRNVDLEFHDNNVIVFNGTSSSGDDTIPWVNENVDIPAGQYIYKVEPYVGNSTLTNGKNIHIDFWYDGNTTTTQDKRVSLWTLKDAPLSAIVNLDYHVWKIRVWSGVAASNTYNNYMLFYSLFPADVVITDTEETIGQSDTIDVTPASEMPVVDTMMHKSSVYTVIDTKTYIDEHTPNVDFVCYRPEDYGAKGDGTTDDYAAIQACINAAQQNTDKTHAIRGYGIYRISQSIVFNAREIDVFFNRIDYAGNDAAVIISASFSRFEFQSIRAIEGSSGAVGIRCIQSSQDGWTNTFFSNDLKCEFVRANGNAVECVQSNGIAELQGSIMYNRFLLSHITSVNANAIYINAYNFGENDFYGKHVNSQNGYALYCAKWTAVRLFGFCFEDTVKNAIYNCGAFLYDYRCSEMLNKQTATDHTKGWLYTFDGMIPFGHADNRTMLDGTSLTCVNVNNALTFSQIVANAKAYFEENPSAGEEAGWATVFPATRPKMKYANYLVVENVANVANANLVPGVVRGINKGTMFVYFDHIGFKPDNDVYYLVEDDMMIQLSSENGYDYVTPTTFDIDVSSATIELDSSYCAIAINRFDVIQHTGKTAIVYDKEGNKIFDGTSLGAGVYHFKCDMEELESLSVTLDGGAVKSVPKAHLRGLYTGSNEKWTISKEELIEA